MTKEHHVIISPGMDGRISGLQFVTRNWKRAYGLHADVLQITWKDTEHFQNKLVRITGRIDEYISQGDTVSVVGCSASGSAMLNAFVERRDVVHKVVNVDGFLRPGTAKGIRSFDRRSAASIAFRESVMRFVEAEPTLTEDNLRKILTVRPLFGDELVPPETVIINGALNKTIPMGEHIASIALSLMFYKPVIMFLKEGL